MTPYYEQSGMTIYHGSALAVLDGFEGLRTESFDLLLTDPPYGIGADKGQQGRANRQDGKALAPSREYLKSDWDYRPAHEAIALSRRLSRWHVIFGGNYYDLPPARCWRGSDSRLRAALAVVCRERSRCGLRGRSCR
jgi:hypothetical protein